jgi:hypothetical protein
MLEFKDGFRDDHRMGPANAVRIGYARVSGRAQDHQMQLAALCSAERWACSSPAISSRSANVARHLGVARSTLYRAL